MLLARRLGGFLSLQRAVWSNTRRVHMASTRWSGVSNQTQMSSRQASPTRLSSTLATHGLEASKADGGEFFHQASAGGLACIRQCVDGFTQTLWHHRPSGWVAVVPSEHIGRHLSAKDASHARAVCSIFLDRWEELIQFRLQHIASAASAGGMVYPALAQTLTADF